VGGLPDDRVALHNIFVMQHIQCLDLAVEHLSGRRITHPPHINGLHSHRIF
jgi:hypothetical protein